MPDLGGALDELLESSLERWVDICLRARLDATDAILDPLLVQCGLQRNGRIRIPVEGHDAESMGILEKVERRFRGLLGQCDLATIHAVGLVEHDDQGQIFPLFLDTKLDGQDALDGRVRVASFSVARLARREHEPTGLVTDVALERSHRSLVHGACRYVAQQDGLEITEPLSRCRELRSRHPSDFDTFGLESALSSRTRSEDGPRHRERGGEDRPGWFPVGDR